MNGSQILVFHVAVERFSFDCRKVIDFVQLRYMIGVKNLALQFHLIAHLIKSKTKTNRDSFAHVFPRFASAIVDVLTFGVLIGSLY